MQKIYIAELQREAEGMTYIQAIYVVPYSMHSRLPLDTSLFIINYCLPVSGVLNRLLLLEKTH